MWRGQMPNHLLARISPGRNWPCLPYLRILAYLTLPSSGHLFLKQMPSTLQGVSAQHVSSWLRSFPTASSVTGRVLEVLGYVQIPAVRARIRTKLLSTQASSIEPNRTHLSRPRTVRYHTLLFRSTSGRAGGVIRKLVFP